MNAVFSLMSWINETRLFVWHELCKWKCGLNESASNSKQKWNLDECQCECNELLICNESNVMSVIITKLIDCWVSDSPLSTTTLTSLMLLLNLLPKSILRRLQVPSTKSIRKYN